MQRTLVYTNTVQSMITLVNAMQSLKIPFENKASRVSHRYVQVVIEYTGDPMCYGDEKSCPDYLDERGEIPVRG